MVIISRQGRLGLLLYAAPSKHGAWGSRHEQGWPEPYIITIYDHKIGDFPAKNTVYTLYVYGSGQP